MLKFFYAFNKIELEITYEKNILLSYYNKFPFQICAFTYLTIVLVSITISAVATHPDLRISVAGNMSEHCLKKSTKAGLLCSTTPHPAIVGLSVCCTFIFFGELIFRFHVWPNKRQFFKNFFNVCDILAVIFAIASIVVNSAIISINLAVHHLVFLMACSTCFRVVRILHIARHNRELRLMYLAMRATLGDFMVLIFLLLIFAFVFAFLVYWAEMNRDDAFLNIYQGIWWSVISLTTVGYGDIYPTEVWGMLIGGVCALTGVVLTGLAIPVLANHFQDYHTCASHTQDTKKTVNNSLPGIATRATFVR